MIKTLGAILLSLALGPGFLLSGVFTLRRRLWRDGVPVLELAIDRALGEEPPPRTKWDQRFALFHAWVRIVFGAFFTLCLAAVIFTIVSE